VFRAHIAAARATRLPLIVHTRDADEDTLSILEEETEEGAFPGLIHCFSAGRELARRAVDMGLYISFSGILTFTKAQEIRDIAAAVPQDRLLVETDAPFLAPMPHRGKRNEPAYVIHTASCLAGVCGLSTNELVALTTGNFLTLFNKIDACTAASVTAQ